MCGEDDHRFREARRRPYLFCSRCGRVEWTPRVLPPTRLAVAPATSESAPPSLRAEQPPEPDALDREVARLLAQEGIDPDELLERARARLEPDVDDDSVTIDGRRFTPHGVSANGRVPVDADIYNESLPDPGI